MTEAIAVTGPLRTDSCFAPCGSHPAAPWLCIYTKPQSEIIALQELRKQGFAVFLPLHSAKLANRQTRIEPLFPRYLMAQPKDGSWSAIRGTKGVASVLRTASGAAQVIPVMAMAILLAQCAPNGVIYPPEPREVSRKDAVRVEDGPFTGFTGICQRTTRDRIWILLSLFGRQSEVPFTRGQVELIS